MAGEFSVDMPTSLCKAHMSLDNLLESSEDPPFFGSLRLSSRAQNFKGSGLTTGSNIADAKSAGTV